MDNLMHVGQGLSDVDVVQCLIACAAGGPETWDLWHMLERTHDVLSLFWIWE